MGAFDFTVSELDKVYYFLSTIVAIEPGAAVDEEFVELESDHFLYVGWSCKLKLPVPLGSHFSGS